MTPPSRLPRPTARLAVPIGTLAVGLIVLGAICWSPAGSAQSAAAMASPPRAAASPAPIGIAPSPDHISAPAPEKGVRWRELKPAQQAVLKPLEREWSTIGAVHKQKWIELSGDFPKRSPADQARIQARMADWARLTAEERGQARLHFQEAKGIDPNDRKARWEAYQALSPEQKQRLAARAAHPAAVPASASVRPVRADAAMNREPQLKSNIVPNTSVAAAPKVVGPGVVQARPGATTTLITKRPTPPLHQQTGLPKIAATPEFVNKATLLPRRGPQGAPTRSATAPASGPSLAQ